MLQSNFKRGILAATLSVTLALGTTSSVFAALFRDTNGYWAQQAIQQLSDQRVIGGYPDGSFHPDGQITRAEFSSILVNALGLVPQSNGNSSFNDVPGNFWATPAIETVKAQGLVSGYPGGLFMPGKNISRAEALVTLANASRMALPDENSASQILGNYRDSNNVPTWAKRAVAGAVQNGIFANDPGSNGYIEPLQPATRGEVAAMVYNLRERLNIAGGNNQNQQQANNQQNYNNNQNYNPSGNTIQGRVSAVPANTKFNGILATPISSELNRVGDDVTVTLDNPLMSSDGQVVIPSGSQAKGKITTIEASGRTGKPAKMGIAFNEIVTPDNRRFQISAQVDTEDGLLSGDTTKGRVLKALGKTAVGAGLGAALGTAMGPLSGGEVGRGAIYGTAVGAGAGAIAAAAGQGKDVVVSTGDKLNIKLLQPLTVTASTGQGGY